MLNAEYVFVQNQISCSQIASYICSEENQHAGLKTSTRSSCRSNIVLTGPVVNRADFKPGRHLSALQPSVDDEISSI